MAYIAARFDFSGVSQSMTFASLIGTMQRSWPAAATSGGGSSVTDERKKPTEAAPRTSATPNASALVTASVAIAALALLGGAIAAHREGARNRD